MSSNSPPLLLFNTTTTTTTTTTSTNANTNTTTNANTINESIKTSILIIVLILSLTIILSLTLCLILRHLNLRLLSSSTSTATAAATPTTASVSSNRHSSHRISPESFQHSVVDSLPLFTFGSIKRRQSSAAADCAVCLCNFEPDDQLRLLPLCCHAFHSHCIDTWLQNNLTCPLCRSPIHASDSDLVKLFSSAPAPAPAPDAARDGSGGSFRLEIGSVSRRRQADHEPRRSYSIGSFEYVVEEESEVTVSETHSRTVSDKGIFGSFTEEDYAAHQPSLAEEVASGGRNWLRDYIDRLSSSVSSRAMSFRGSGRFFTGSSRRSDAVVGEYDLEANGVGEEISEFFRWFSGV